MPQNVEGVEGGKKVKMEQAMLRVESFSLKRLYWKLLHVTGFKSRVWDSQYKTGLWRADNRSPITIRKVFELCAGGHLLEFGCGEGDLLGQLPPKTYSEYSGLDISRAAIDNAQAFSALNCATQYFQVCSMEDWDGAPQKYSLILLEECLYYLSRPAARKFLRRCRASLTQDGRILVIMHDAKKHEKMLDLCRHHCEVVSEEYQYPRVFLTLK
jgi:cyclopropane fatty-acyl-phospholipid synthase-like methyltransferase